MEYKRPQKSTAVPYFFDGAAEGAGAGTIAGFGAGAEDGAGAGTGTLAGLGGAADDAGGAGPGKF